MRKFRGRLTRGEQTIDVTGGISVQGIGFIDVPSGVSGIAIGEASLELEHGETGQIMISTCERPSDVVSFKPHF